MTIERAAQILEVNYRKALEMPGVIRDPVAWALYRTWRAADAAGRKEAKRHESNPDPTRIQLGSNSDPQLTRSTKT